MGGEVKEKVREGELRPKSPFLHHIICLVSDCSCSLALNAGGE